LRRLLVVSPLFPNNKQPSKGIFVKECLLQLRKHFDIRVVSPIPWASRMRASINHRGAVDGIEVWYPPYLRIPSAGNSLDGFFYYLSLSAFMKKFVDRYACDAILAHWAYPDAFGVILMNYTLKKPIFIQVHGSDINSGIRTYLRRKLIAFALKRARIVFSVAYDLQDKMMGLGIGRDRICVAPNGANHAAFCPRDRNTVRGQLGLPLEKKIVLFVGNLVDVKGLSYLIEAAALLSKERNDLLFLILGEGPRKERLHSMIRKYQLQEDVRLLGGKAHADIPYWISGCDLLCLPSLSEGCPTVVIEALASGRPVVGTEVGDVPRLLKLPFTGYTVRAADSKALADGIAKALAQVWDPGVISRSVREMTWENTASKICAQVSAELQGSGKDCPACSRQERT
jgi:glycosyltransferase involved in cell wall biosynthesis